MVTTTLTYDERIAFTNSAGPEETLAQPRHRRTPSVTTDEDPRYAKRRFERLKLVAG